MSNGSTVTMVAPGFQEWLQSGRPQRDQVSASTAERYARYVEQMCAHTGNPLRVTRRRLLAWREEIERCTLRGEEKAATARTINVKISAVRAYFEYLVATGQRSDNPATELQMARVAARRPTAIPRAVLNRLFEALYAAEPTPIVLQDRAILETLYGSGLRRDEAARLCLRNLESPEVLYVVGKGNKDRRTMVSTPQYVALRTWALHRVGDERTADILTTIDADAAFTDLRRRFPDVAFFYTSTGSPVPELADPGRFIWERAKHWFGVIGEKRRTHDIRHSFVTHMLDSGGDLLAVADMVGHADVSTTRMYRGQGEETFHRARTVHPRGFA